jgi:hypothetical protein
MGQMRRLPMRLIQVARRLLCHTRLGKTKLAAQIYALVFELSAPDLTRPISFRDTSLSVDPDDRACVPSMVGGYFEKIELDIFEQLVADCEVFFDVGANIGVYSLIGCLRSERLKAYAFEPASENEALLRKNVASHRLEQRTSVQPMAVSTDPAQPSFIRTTQARTRSTMTPAPTSRKLPRSASMSSSLRRG